MALPLIPIIAGVGKAIGGLAKGINEATKPKKATQFVTGKGKKGGAIVVRQKTGIDKAAKIMGGKSSALAVIDKPKTQLGFRDINTQIDNIVGQTVSIRKIVVTQYALDKSSFEKNRKSQENLKRKKRESELESKKRSKGQLGLGISSLPGGNMVTRYLTNILLGAATLAILKNLDKIESGYNFALKNAHKIWLGVRYGLGAFVQTMKGLSNFIRKTPWIQKLSKRVGRLAKKSKINILKRFRDLRKALTLFGTRLWTRVIKAGETLVDFIRGGDQVRRLGDLKRLKEQRNKLRRLRKLKETKLLADKVRSGSLLSSTASAGKIFKHGVGRGANRVILKWFGPQAAKRLAPLTKTFKVAAKAAKGIKIPVVGPIIVLITSLLSGEGTNKALFKGFGTLFGGLLGSPLGPLGMILGEILGEVFGEVLYEGFMGKDGWSGAGKLLKAKWDGFVQGSKDAAKWIFSGTGRLIKNWPKVFVGSEVFGKKIGISTPDPSLLVKPKALGKHIWDSFFPKDGTAQVEKSAPRSDSKGVESSASYEEGAETVIPVPLPDLGSGMEGPIIIENRIPVLNNSSVNSTIKSRNMANLGFA